MEQHKSAIQSKKKKKKLNRKNAVLTFQRKHQDLGCQLLDPVKNLSVYIHNQVSKLKTIIQRSRNHPPHQNRCQLTPISPF